MKTLYKLLKHNKMIICLAITAGSLVMTATVFRGAFSSAFLAAAELWQSFVAYMMFAFLAVPPAQSPIAPPSDEIPNILPSDPVYLESDIEQFFTLLFGGENFVAYIDIVGVGFLYFVRMMPLVLAFWYLARRYIRRGLTEQNNDYNVDTRPLRAYKRILKSLFAPPMRYVGSLLEYIKQTRFVGVWLLIWLFNFNALAIILSAFSAGLFFSISLDFVSLYFFVYNAVVLLLPMFQFLPWWLWVLFALWLVDRWRKRRALNVLRHNENKNKGLINSLSLATYICGTMGKGKTTLLTDMVLSAETIQRHEAYERMITIDMQFPNFPWIVFENELRAEVDADKIYNASQCKAWVSNREKLFRRTLRKQGSKITRLVWGYDFETYGLEYNNGKEKVGLFDALRNYARLYLIYAITTASIIQANYSIRTDFVQHSVGNFPMWDMDFFEKDPRELKKMSRYSKIIDYDLLRLGKKMLENSKGMFEFGIGAVTEIGKERCNQLKNLEIKDTIKSLQAAIKTKEKGSIDCAVEKEELTALTEGATRVNDGFNNTLKLIRHPSTIAHYPFARFFTDEQRPESLGADARDLFQIIHIREVSKVKLAMPLYFIGELVYSFVFGRFRRTYEEYRFNRGDNTLLMHWLKKIGSAVHRARERIYNRFGYMVVDIGIEDAATGKIVKECKCYLSIKKVYSSRYSSDAFEGIFAERLKECGLSLQRMREYADIKMTVDEMQAQNSYFVQDLLKYSKGHVSDNEITKGVKQQ